MKKRTAIFALIISMFCLCFSGCGDSGTGGVNEPPTSHAPTWKAKNELSRGDKNFDETTASSVTTQTETETETTTLSETQTEPETTTATEPETTTTEPETTTVPETTTTAPPVTTTVPPATTTAPPTTAATNPPTTVTSVTTTTAATTAKTTVTTTAPTTTTTVTTTTAPETTTTVKTTAPLPIRASVSKAEWKDGEHAVYFDITFENVTEDSYAWIGIVKKDERWDERFAVESNFANKKLSSMTSGKRESISASLPTGNYEVRIYTEKGCTSPISFSMFTVGSDKIIADNSSNSSGVFELFPTTTSGGSGGGSSGGSCISCGKPIYSGNYCRYHYEEDQWIAGKRPDRPNPSDYP